MGIWELIGILLGIDAGSTEDVAKNWNLRIEVAFKKEMVNNKYTSVVIYHMFLKVWCQQEWGFDQQTSLMSTKIDRLSTKE